MPVKPATRAAQGDLVKRQQVRDAIEALPWTGFYERGISEPLLGSVRAAVLNAIDALDAQPVGLDVGDDLRTLRRSLPVIVDDRTAELWMAYGRIEKALGHGIYAALASEPQP